jgi:hypothetical protein
LSVETPQAGALVFTWPANPPGFVLQQNNDLSTASWVMTTNAVRVVGTINRVNISPLTGKRFFRLQKP